VPRPAGYVARNAVGVAAATCGLAGLVSAIVPPAWIDPPPWRLRDELVGLVVDVGRGRQDLQVAAYHAALRNWQRCAVALAVISVALAVLAGIQRQDRRLVISALGLAAAALLWPVLATALVVGIALAMLAAALA
jgi:hypothetical protein